MWVDFVSQNVVPAAKKVIDMVTGELPSDQKSFSITLNEFKGTLASIEEHLALRNFLQGHQMSIADALLVATLTPCFELVLDKKSRDKSLSNLTRYTTIILRMAPCQSVFGQVLFCKDVVKPAFDVEKPKDKPAAAAGDAKAQGKAQAKGKDSKGQDGKGKPQQQDGGKGKDK